MIIKFVRNIFPLVNQELDGWRTQAGRIPDSVLRKQALASIKTKQFHVQGGSIYALYPQANPKNAVRFIVALQTISDYLDNLCDRAGVMDESAFFQLHLAMVDAVDLDRNISDYYFLYPFKNDGGYLNNLVRVCREQIRNQPSYPVVKPIILKYIKRYSELQSYKHLSFDIRESSLRYWALDNIDPAIDIRWWEYAAATGSTLGMFLLFVAASVPELKPEPVEAMDNAYFPWITGLHILLDYYIDAEEDREMGDFNFTFQYPNFEECRMRLGYFIFQAMAASKNLPYFLFHQRVIQGLLAMYLSDPKALTREKKQTSLRLIRWGGLRCGSYYRGCRLLRKIGVI